MIPSLLLSVIIAPVTPVLRPVDLADVKLMPGPFQAAQEANAKVLLSRDPERFLHFFRKNAGLEPKAPSYGGWETMGIAGHSLGHYLSAVAREYRRTGDDAYKQKLDALVAGLKECQDKVGTGYVAAIPEGDRVFAEIKRGEIRTANFELNGVWVPWYTLHKQFAGLLDAHAYAGSSEALGVAKKLADWAIDVTANLNEEQWQKMLACEHGGMNESMAELYARTGEKKYLDFARKFDHKAILDPLRRGEDKLAGHHSNTQIPKLIGLARLYELEGKEEDRKTAETFWERVVRHHSYTIGGNSDHEYFGQPDKLNDRLSTNSAECCNSYNMVKLSHQLFSWKPTVENAEFVERVLWNHLLAAIDPETGMNCYYMPLAAGTARQHSDMDDSWWCCVGTGMENPARYSESIYFREGERTLYISQFISSEVFLRDVGLRFRVTSGLPSSGSLKIEVLEGNADFEVVIRHPSWAPGRFQVKAGNAAFKDSQKPGEFLRIKRQWIRRQVVNISLPAVLRTETMPDNPNRFSLFYGPVLLAADLGPDNEPAPRIPGVVVGADRPLSEWLTKDPEGSNGYVTKGEVARPGEIMFRPFYSLHHRRTAPYIDRYTEEGWQAAEAARRAEEQRKQALELKTVDFLKLGDPESERTRNIQGEKTTSGSSNGSWRHATDGGWFSFDLKADPNAELELILTLWGSDGGGREFDILVDGKVLKSMKLERPYPGRFFDETLTLPLDLTKGKEKVTVKLQAKPGMMAGGLYGARLVRKS